MSNPQTHVPSATTSLTTKPVTTISRAPYPTSFSAMPTVNADYAAMTKSQHSAYCATAKQGTPQYTQACINGIWQSLYGRTAAAEDLGEEQQASVTSIAVPISSDAPTTFATMTRSKSVDDEVEKTRAAADLLNAVADMLEGSDAGEDDEYVEADDGSEVETLQKRGFWDLVSKIGNLFGKKGH